MKEEIGTFNVLTSIERHIEALKPLLPKQAMVAIGEYPIKTVLKEPVVQREGTLLVFVEKSSEDIYTWIPRGFDPYFVLGFEDARLDTHFWYNMWPTAMMDNSIAEALKKKPDERLNNAIIFSSIWDGLGSASLPTLISKFKTSSINSLSLAVLPSKIQPPDAHFNAYAALQLCQRAEASTVLLLDRDQIDSYEGVDRKGEPLKGNMAINYLLNLFLAKESLVSEISELSRTFNVKLFGSIIVTGASLKIYGSLENMLNAAWLKPLLNFELPSASLLYVLIRMPSSLRDTLSRSKIELAVANWFKDKTSLQSIYITEPIYTDDMNDRVDAVLFVGGFDTTALFGELQKKIGALKDRAVELGFLTEDWQVKPPKVEEPKPVEVELPPPPPPVETLPVPEEPKITPEASIVLQEPTAEASLIQLETEQPIEAPPAPLEEAKSDEAKPVEKPKRTRKITKKTATPKRRKKTEKVEEQKNQETSA